MVRVWMYFYVSNGGMRKAHRLDTELYEHLPFSCPPVLLRCLESRVGDARVIDSWAHLTSHFTDGAGLAVRSVLSARLPKTVSSLNCLLHGLTIEQIFRLLCHHPRLSFAEFVTLNAARPHVDSLNT